MNERIMALAHEAGLPTYNPEGIPTKLEKFAQLIVRECVGIVNINGSQIECEIAADIKEHFGVE